MARRVPKREQSQDDERRRRAEARLAAERTQRAEAVPSSSDTPRLVQELHVHQIELEMQNEELRRARQETEDVLHRYTDLFEFAPVGYVVLDGGACILEANLEFARMVGVNRSAVIGVPFVRFFDLAQRTRLRRFFLNLGTEQAERGHDSLEVTLERADGGATLAVRLIASTHLEERATVFVAVHDLTAAKRVEAALDDVERKDQFLATLSHELRNPLFPIRTSLVLLGRVEPGSAQARKAIATIDRQVAHLARIVDDLLEVTRITRGKINLRRERLELGGLVRQAMDDHRAEFQEKSLALEAHLGDEPLWVDADATRIIQVVGNLLVNASKFTPSGGRVEVSLRRDGLQAVLSLRDTGVGIAPDMRDQLFVPFSQAPQALARTGGGLGLGLAMVKGLVELHDGTVNVTSEGPGRGSEFIVRLPLVEPPAAKKATGASVQGLSSHRILVIEDNVDAADTMRELLVFDGQDARVAYDGSSGLAVAREFHPEVVLCDIGLPEMDGYEVARQMRADPDLSGTYLVALSGYARPEDRRRSAAAGFDLHLAKPPSVDELERVLATRPTFGTPR